MKIALIENSGIDFYNSRVRYALYLKGFGYEVSAIVPDDGFLEKIKSKQMDNSDLKKIELLCLFQGDTVVIHRHTHHHISHCIHRQRLEALTGRTTGH